MNYRSIRRLQVKKCSFFSKDKNEWTQQYIEQLDQYTRVGLVKDDDLDFSYNKPRFPWLP